MTAPVRRRTRAREIAMQALYQLDLRHDDYAQALDGAERGQTIAELCRAEIVTHIADDEDVDQDLARELNRDEQQVLAFAVQLVEGTLQHREEIDRTLQSVARNWNLRRMAVVDRNVLRMAVYELMFCRDVPPKVAINEAIEIGKKYSTANSGGFVNGLLDRIRIDQTRGGGSADGSSG